MDFLDPKKKRAHQVRLFIGYGLMAVVLLIGTLILVWAARGFDFDRKTGAIIQNGLVYVDSHPTKGTVYINGERKADADTRLTLPASQYELQIRKDGYRTWSRNFDLIGGTIERFVYAFLWPERLESKELATYGAAPSFVTQSPDRRWLLVQQPGSFNSFTVTDLRSDENPATSLSVPTDILTPGPGANQLQLVEWSTDNRHVLIKHSFQGGDNFVIIDREQPTASLNLNKVFAGTAFNAARLRDKRADQLYLHNTADGTLVTADTRSRIVTPSVTKVLAFQPHGDDVVLYVTNDGTAEGTVAVRVRQGQVTYNIRELPVGTTYLIDLARFENRWYLAAGVNTDPRIYLYRDMFDRLRESPDKPLQTFSVLRVENPEYLAFSANTRFIGVQGGSRFAVYDAEMQRSYRFDTGLQLAPGQKATWMDGHRYVINSGGKLVVFEFDGFNQQTLIDAHPSYLPYFDRDYNVLFTFAPQVADAAKTSLNRTELRLPQDR